MEKFNLKIGDKVIVTRNYCNNHRQNPKVIGWYKKGQILTVNRLRDENTLIGFEEYSNALFGRDNNCVKVTDFMKLTKLSKVLFT